ncbi:MAG: hypothetical protein ACE5KT_09270 [Methanosarcinales archaeon]
MQLYIVIVKGQYSVTWHPARALLALIPDTRDYRGDAVRKFLVAM